MSIEILERAGDYMLVRRPDNDKDQQRIEGCKHALDSLLDYKYAIVEIDKANNRVLDYLWRCTDYELGEICPYELGVCDWSIEAAATWRSESCVRLWWHALKTHHDWTTQTR